MSNAVAPKIAALVDPAKADADPQADLAALTEAVDRLASEKAEALKLLRQIEAARPGLLLTEDGAALDKIDRREKDAHRTVARVDVAIPLLKARADAVREAATKAKAEPHIRAARAARKRVDLAAVEFMAANEAAARVVEKASSDLGSAAARLYVPTVGFCAMPAADALAHWRGVLDRLFGDVPPPPPPAGRVLCKVTGQQFSPYMPGDVITLPDAEARAAKEAGQVEFTRPDDVAEVFDPRKAPMPEPVAGRVTLVFLRHLVLPWPHPDAGTYQTGEVRTLSDLKLAEKLVRAGSATWWTGGPDEQ